MKKVHLNQEIYQGAVTLTGPADHELEDSLADYLLETFPGWFSLVETPKKKEAEEAPEAAKKGKK